MKDDRLAAADVALVIVELLIILILVGVIPLASLVRELQANFKICTFDRTSELKREIRASNYYVNSRNGLSQVIIIDFLMEPDSNRSCFYIIVAWENYYLDLIFKGEILKLISSILVRLYTTNITSLDYG